MSAQVTAPDRLTLDEMLRLAPPEAPGEATWLSKLRSDAAEWVVDHGFPSAKHEDWRYVDLRPLLELPFASARIPGDDEAAPGLAGLLGPDLGGPRLVLVNGRYAPGLSRLADLRGGVRVTSLASLIQAGDETVGDMWRTSARGWSHGFEALNAALAVDGGFVEVAESASLDVPIEIVHVAIGSDVPPLCNPRTFIRIGAAGSATVVETYLGSGQGGSLTNAHTEIVLAEGAAVDHYRFQAETCEAYHLSRLEVRPGPTARFTSHLVAVGARLGRHELRAFLAGAGATVDLDGLFIPRGAQCHDNPVRVEHTAPGCTSDQLYKGIVDGAGHGVFNGHVIVHPGAAGTDANQVNKNLLLSDRSEVDTRPRLEIFADDVACTHGAAVGQLDPDAMFYLRSRGISEPEARSVLVAGFAQEILSRVPPGPVRDRAESLVATHLQDGGAQ